MESNNTEPESILGETIAESTESDPTEDQPMGSQKPQPDTYPDETRDESTESNSIEDTPESSFGGRWRRRSLLRAVGAASAAGLTAPLISGAVRAEHETDPCPVTIEFNSTHVAHVFDVEAAGLTSLTVFYFDPDGNAQKQEDIDPTRNAEYGDAPLKIRYDADEDKTTVQIGGSDAAVRRIVAFGPDCRSAKTSPIDGAAGDNEEPTADFTWTPDPGFVAEPTTFTSTADDPDGELIHHGWDFDNDGTEDATGEEVDHIFTTAGDHDVTHTVIDDFDATDSETKSVPVILPWDQQQKLLAPDGEAHDRFGTSVAVDGDTAIVSGHREDEKGDDAGAVYVFTWDGSDWSRQQKLLAPDGEADDRFGFSVALDGDTAVVGAHREDEKGDDAGAAYVFTRSGDTWSRQQKLLAPDGEADDRFGFSIALDGDTAVVGARFEDEMGDDAGAAYVFTRSGDTWGRQQKLLAPDGEPNDLFGHAVGLDGDTAVVGAPSEDEKGSRAGAAYVFTRSGDTWGRQQKLLAPDGEAHDRFGDAVGLDGDTAVVGAFGEDENGFLAGAAYVFTRSGDTWRRQQKLLAPDGEAHDRFGEVVAVDGDTAIVGAIGDDEKAANAGAAYVFTRSGDTWRRQQKLLAPDGEDGDLFGVVAVNGDTAIVGAPQEDEKGFNAGAAYVFEKRP